MEISLENLYVDTAAWVKKNNQGFFGARSNTTKGVIAKAKQIQRDTSVMSVKTFCLF